MPGTEDLLHHPRTPLRRDAGSHRVGAVDKTGLVALRVPLRHPLTLGDLAGLPDHSAEGV